MVSSPFERTGGDDEISQRITRSLASPFGVWSTSQSRNTVIAILAVYGFVFLAGLVGHVCVVAYTISSRRKYHNCRRGALLILGNLSCSQMIFLLCCLPSIAYQSIMKLTYEPWMLTDTVCRMVPFLKLFLLGVTVFSFCVLSVDRLRSAGQNAKSHGETEDTTLTRICKLIVIWIGAMIIASPEIFVHGVKTEFVRIPKNIFDVMVERDPNVLGEVQPPYHRLRDIESNMMLVKTFMYKLDPTFSIGKQFALSNVTTVAATYQYEKCEVGKSLWSEPPHFLAVFINVYYDIRLWWIFGFYFCLPVFFSLISALVVALKLSRAHDKCVKDYGNYPVEGVVGTLTSHKGSLNRSNSVTSNQTLSSEAQQLMLADGRPQILPYHNGSLRNGNNHRSASPANSYPGGVMTPMIVRACNASISPSEPHHGYAHSPITSPSMTSHLYEANGTNPRKTSSLPPHGRGSRGRSRMQKVILFNIARDRSLNTLLVALLLAFSLTWLPQHIFQILFAKTHIQGTLDPAYVNLINNICTYLSTFGFAVNPVVIYLSYKSYRLFLDRVCCQCRCC